jgi:hypothetical protein
MGINKHIGGHNMTYQKRLTSNDITSIDQTLQMLKYIRTLENLMGKGSNTRSARDYRLPALFC